MAEPKERAPLKDRTDTFSMEKGGQQLEGRLVRPGAPHHEHAVSDSTEPGAQGLPQVHAALLCPLTNCHLHEEERDPNA